MNCGFSRSFILLAVVGLCFASENARQASAGYDLDFTVKVDGAQLSASLGIAELPKSGKKLPIALILPGAQLWDRNGNIKRGAAYGHYRDISESLANKGFAVCRYDKRGVGDSTGLAAFDAPSLAADARSVLYAVMKRSDVDGKKVLLVGHSQGAAVVTQMLMGDRFLQPAGVALLSPAAEAQEIVAVLKCPVFIAHGALDQDVSPPFIERAASGLREKGLPVSVFRVPGGSHLLFDVAAGEPSYDDPATTISPALLDQLATWAAALIAK